MPTYQYACTECGHQLEAVQSFSDPALTECPNCAGKLRKRYNSVGIVFKGSGFYRNDSRAGAANGNGSDSSATKAESSSSSSGDSSASTTSSSSSSSGASSTGTSSAASSGAAKPSGSGTAKAAATP